jgi:hypothetical protein
MRFPFAMLLCACQGESVASTTTAAASDTGGEFAAVCSMTGNLVTNGDFAGGVGGWANNAFVVEAATGPCGKGLRLTATTANGELGQTVERPFAKGTRFRLRALFRIVKQAGTIQPGVLARFLHGTGTAEAYTQTLVAQTLSSKEWQRLEIAAPLERDEDRVKVFVQLDESAGDVFEVGAVTLTVE